MDFLKQNKMAIVLGVVLIAGIFVYMTYFSGPAAPAALTQSDTDATLSQNLVVTLQNLHTIKLDDSIFSEPAFLSLTDFGVVIPPQTPGRRNPFAPLGASTQTQNATGTVNLTLPKTN